jgi:hypothetical protein
MVQDCKDMKFHDRKEFAKSWVIVWKTGCSLIHAIHDEAKKHCRIGMSKIPAEPVQGPFSDNLVSMGSQHLIDLISFYQWGRRRMLQNEKRSTHIALGLP